MVTFSTGLPPIGEMIVCQEIGVCSLVRHIESGEVDLYIGNGKTMRCPGSYSWRYAEVK